LLPATGSGKLFKTRLAAKCYLDHRVFALPKILCNCGAEAGLDQRFLISIKAPFDATKLIFI
ncbi:MAG: hypothetical protein ABSE51_18430, partial [Terracidiphilus sp.]